MTEAAVLAALASGPKTSRDLVALAGCDIRGAIAALKREGRIERIKRSKKLGQSATYALVQRADGPTVGRCECGAKIDPSSLRCRSCAGKAARIWPERPVDMSDRAGDEARSASAALHDRIHALYARTADRLGCSVEAAMLVLNRTPAQLAKMAA